MAAELAIIAKLQDEASSGIRALRGEVEGLGTSGETAGRGFSSLQAAGTVALTAIAGAALAAGAALVGFFSGSVEKAAALEAQMDTVAALLGATADQAELLRQATLDLALDPNLSVSATEAAQAIEMLAQNGLTVEQILGGAAEATVQLANATGADFTTAARIATDAMALWGMEADQLGQVADGVTAVLVQSKFEVNDYALALAQAGGVAAAVGVSFEDFNATLVAIAPFFASGSDAGTSYKTMLQRLIPTTAAARDAMADLGMITEDGANAFFNADGSMRDMAEVAGILNSALSGLSEQQRLQALSTIFGTDAMRAAAAMSQFTEEEFRNLMAVMANTSAAEIAAQRMQNFSGAMDILKGVIEGLQIMLGNVLLPILTQMALAGSNLLAAYGPPLIAAFERLVAIFSEFFTSIQSGMTVWEALRTALSEIGQLFGMTAAEASTFAAGVASVVQAIVSFIAPIAQAIASFVSWKDVLLAVGIAIGSVVLPVLIGIVQAVAPVIAVFAALVLAIAALRTAFETNFLGIRDLALGVWAALQQVFEGIRALLSGDTTTAMAAFRSAWEAGWSAIAGFVQNAGSQIGQALAGLWGSIVAWFQGIDWGALAQSLIDRFFAGMASLGQAAAGSWEWLLTSITNFITGTDWGALGHTLIDLLVSGIIGAVGLIGTAIGGIVTFIWNFITGTDWIALGTNLVNAIIDGLRTFGEGAGEALGEWRQRIFDWAGAEDWGGVGDKIAEMVGDALGTAKEAVAAKLTEWKTAIFDWAGAEDWQGVAQHIAEMIGEKLGEMGQAISGQLSEWQTAIFDWAGAEDWQGVAQHIAEMIGEKLGEMGRPSPVN
jgi:TP901 family phage tail tape measure protein